MKRQNFYANFPSKLYQESFKSDKDRNFHLLAMAYFVSFVHTGDGYFYISKNRLAQLLKCSTKKALEILHNLEEWGYIEKQQEGVNHHSQTVYRIATYDFDFTSEEILQDDTQISEDLGTTKIHHQNTPAETSNIGNESEFKNQQNTPLKEQQTNNELTNNDITNNEIKTNNEKSSLTHSNFEKHKDPDKDGKTEESIKQTIDEELGIVRPKYLVSELPREDKIDPKQLETELQRLIAFYPKKSGNFRRLRDRYRYLRLKKKLRFEEIYEAIDGYMLEMDAQGVEQKYWKTLDTLFDPVELDPWLYKPTISIDKKGQRFKGEFCIATRVIRYHVPKLNRIETQILSERKVDQMIEEGRLIFLDKDNIDQEVREVCHAK